MKKFINANIYRQEESTEILVKDGKIVEIGNGLADADEVIDLEGKLVLPPYVDPHIHLDYVYTGQDDGSSNKSGTLFEGIARWSDIKKNHSIQDVKDRAKRAIKEEVSHGVQYIRTHVDVTDPALTGMQAMLELREEMKDIIDLQIVSFPQEGMFSYKNGLELVEEGLKMGADAVGGIPHTEWAREIGEKSVHKIMKLALKHDKLIDVHIDETDDPMARFVELLNALVLMEDYGARTAASHTVSFGSVSDAYATRMLGLFNKSQMNFIVAPTENAYLQAREDSYPKRRGLTRVKELLEHDVNVAFAQDSIADPWYPLGNGNLMNILDNGIHLAQIMEPEDNERNLDLITFNGAKAMNIEEGYGIEVGNDANFIVLNESTPFEAIRQRADVLASVRKGEFLFRKKPQEFYEINDFLL